MTKWILLAASATLAVVAWRNAPVVSSQQEPPDTVASVRIQLGIADENPTDWSGSVAVTGGGQLAGLRHWRPRPGDKIEGANFTVATRKGVPFVHRAWEETPI